MKRIYTLFAFVAVLLSIVACSPDISFIPVENPNTEVEGDDDSNTENEENNPNEGTDDENNTDTENPDEGAGNDERNDTENEDDTTQSDQGSEEVIEPNADVEPWIGAVADDVSKDVVGTDADLYVELNSFTKRVVVRYDGTTATVENSNSAIIAHISGAYVTIDMSTNNVDGVEIVAQG